MLDTGNKSLRGRLCAKGTGKNSAFALAICYSTAKLTCRYGSQRNSGQVKRLVRQYDYSIKLRPAFVFFADVECTVEQKYAEEANKCAGSEAD